MKLLKFVLSTAVSFSIVISIVILIIFIPAVENFFKKNIDSSMSHHFLTVFLLFFLLIIMSCLFAPRPKKIGAITSIVICVLLCLIEVYYHPFWGDNFNPILISSYWGIINGLGIGYFISYITFKEKGW